MLYRKKTTHLVCKTASGAKFQNAKQWDLPVVSEGGWDVGRDGEGVGGGKKSTTHFSPLCSLF